MSYEADEDAPEGPDVCWNRSSPVERHGGTFNPVMTASAIDAEDGAVVIRTTDGAQVRVGLDLIERLQLMVAMVTNTRPNVVIPRCGVCGERLTDHTLGTMLGYRDARPTYSPRRGLQTLSMLSTGKHRHGSSR